MIGLQNGVDTSKQGKFGANGAFPGPYYWYELLKTLKSTIFISFSSSKSLQKTRKYMTIMAPPVNFVSRRPFHKHIIHCICHNGKINLSKFSHVEYFMYAKFSYLMTPPHSRYAIIMIYSIISFDCFQFKPLIRNLNQNPANLQTLKMVL